MPKGTVSVRGSAGKNGPERLVSPKRPLSKGAPAFQNVLPVFTPGLCAEWILVMCLGDGTLRLSRNLGTPVVAGGSLQGYPGNTHQAVCSYRGRAATFSVEAEEGATFPWLCHRFALFMCFLWGCDCL